MASHLYKKNWKLKLKVPKHFSKMNVHWMFLKKNNLVRGGREASANKIHSPYTIIFFFFVSVLYNSVQSLWDLIKAVNLGDFHSKLIINDPRLVDFKHTEFLVFDEQSYWSTILSNRVRGRAHKGRSQYSRVL